MAFDLAFWMEVLFLKEVLQKGITHTSLWANQLIQLAPLAVSSAQQETSPSQKGTLDHHGRELGIHFRKYLFPSEWLIAAWATGEGEGEDEKIPVSLDRSQSRSVIRRKGREGEPWVSYLSHWVDIGIIYWDGEGVENGEILSKHTWFEVPWVI